MTDRKDLTLYVKRLFKKHKWMVNNLGWKVNLVFLDNIDEVSEDSLKHTLMMVNRNWGYLDANLYVILENIIGCSEKELESILLHELCHILVSPIRENETESSEEHVVTTLSRIMLRLQGSNLGVS